MRGFFSRLLQALTLWLRKPGALLLSLCFTAVHMLCVYGVFLLCFDGMGEQIPLWLLAGLYSLAYFVTLIPVSINGYGLQEISLTFVFSNLADVSISHSLTAALLYRTLTLIASLPGALFVPGFLAGKKSSD